MANKIRPTLVEDMSLAQNGNIRTDDGEIKNVGVQEAYKIIDTRRRTLFYNGPSPEEPVSTPKPEEPKIDTVTPIEQPVEEKKDVGKSTEAEPKQPEPGGDIKEPDGNDEKSGGDAEPFKRGPVVVGPKSKSPKSKSKSKPKSK